MNDHPSPRRMRITPIGELGCQNETRGGSGSTCAWRTLSTHFKNNTGSKKKRRNDDGDDDNGDDDDDDDDYDDDDVDDDDP